MECNIKCREINEELLSRVYNIFERNYDLTTDSRQIKQGSIFVALKGANFDGNSFALQVLKQGAVLAIIDNREFYVDERTILVENCLLFLQKFAIFHRKKLSLPVIALSGTNGKTTTKELISCVLQKKYNVLSTYGNLNNQIGVPLTLLKLRKQHQLAVIEMGASHIGDIDELCRIADPDIAVLTNIGTAHIEGFGSKEGVIKTKTELFRYVDNKNGKIFINSDDENIYKFKAKNSTTYSLLKNADIKASIFDKTSIFANIEIEGIKIQSRLVGSYNAYNILASVCIGRYFSVPLIDIKDAIEQYIPTNNRSQITKTESNTLILDCYNANPSSCKYALEAFDNICSDNKMVFMGAMKELGQDSDKYHCEIVSEMKAMNLKKIILVGKEYEKYSCGENIFWFEDSSKALSFIQNREKIQHALILIKGSRATQMEKLANGL